MARFSFHTREISILVVLVFAALAFRFILFPAQGLPGDVNCYISWFDTAAQYGIRPFYTVCWCDYPPFNVYIFWIGGVLANAVSSFGISATNIVKLIPNLFDVGTAVLIFFFLRKQATFKQSLLGAGLYAFNPAVIYNAAVWGQLDAIYTFFLILSLLLALKNKPEFSAAVFAVAVLTKPQAIALLPLLIFLIYEKNGWKKLLISISIFGATVFAVILPFEWSNPLTFLSDVYFGAYGGYAVTSANAFNLWGLYGLWLKDSGLNILGWILFGGFGLFILYFFKKRFKVSGDFIAVFAAFMFFFAFFMLPTRIHERYLFPAISLLSLMFLFVKYSRLLFLALTGTLLVNQAYVLIKVNLAVNAGVIAPNLTGDPIVLLVSSINLIMFFYAVAIMLAELKGKGSFNHYNKLNIPQNNLEHIEQKT